MIGKKISKKEEQRFSGYCKVQYPDRTCDVCEDGYYKDKDNACHPCKFENCKKCNKDECLECLDTFGKNSNDMYRCTRTCEEGCAQCDNPTYGTCAKCLDTHFFNMTDYTCEPCSKKYQDCQTCDDTKCKTFKCQNMDPTCPSKLTPGMFFSSKTNKCEKCATDCHKCIADETGSSKCVQCMMDCT